MSDLEKSSFRFVNFIVRESHIVLNSQGEFQINVNFNPKGYIFKALNQFHLELAVTITEQSERFHVNLVSIGVFEFDEGADLEAYKSSFFTLNAPAIIYPYIRAYVSTLTTQSGVFNVTLPTYNLTALADSLKKSIVEIIPDLSR